MKLLSGASALMAAVKSGQRSSAARGSPPFPERFWVWSLGFRVSGLGFRVRFRAKGLGFRAHHLTELLVSNNNGP